MCLLVGLLVDADLGCCIGAVRLAQHLPWLLHLLLLCEARSDNPAVSKVPPVCCSLPLQPLCLPPVLQRGIRACLEAEAAYLHACCLNVDQTQQTSKCMHAEP